jgi:pimeloyl-ACP methyl ester carboxylesterase
MLRTPRAVAASAFAGISEARRWSVDPTTVPTLAIYAKPGGADSEPTLRKMFSNLQFVEWENVGHFIMMEKPREFNETILRFVNSLPARREPLR